MKFPELLKRANFNDTLALALGVVVIPGLWVLNGMNIAHLPEIVIGATITLETLIAQYYFRKAKDEPQTPA